MASPDASLPTEGQEFDYRQNMSHLKEMLLFQKKSLKKTKVNVTTPAGRQVCEIIRPDGCIVEEGGYAGPYTAGYCVDTNPDLKVATIRKGLLLGSQDVAADFPLLQRLGVTHIVNLASYVKNCFENQGIKYLKIEVMDIPEQDILQHFPTIFKFMDEARTSGGCVYVHCNAGVSRAPTVVTGYLMQTEGLSRSDALSQVQAKRFVFPNEGFMRQLHQFELMCSRQQTSNSTPDSSNSTQGTSDNTRDTSDTLLNQL